MKTTKKLIQEVLDQIFEGLSEPIGITLDRNGNGYYGQFNIDEANYELTFREITKDCFIFDFSRDKNHNLQHDIKKAFTVIPTIRKVVKDFIQEKRPKLFVITKDDASMGRDRLYSTFTSEISEEFGYNKTIKDGDDGRLRVYILDRGDATLEDFTETVGEAIGK